MISTLHYSSHKRHTSSTSVRAHIDDPRAASQRKRTLKKPIATSRAAARAHVPRAARVPRARPAPTHARIKYNINTRAHPPSRAITAPPASRASPANDRRKMVLDAKTPMARKRIASPSRALPRTRDRPTARARVRTMDVPVVLPDTDAGIRGAEIDPDRRAVDFTHGVFLCLCRVVE